MIWTLTTCNSEEVGGLQYQTTWGCYSSFATITKTYQSFCRSYTIKSRWISIDHFQQKSYSSNYILASSTASPMFFLLQEKDQGSSLRIRLSNYHTCINHNKSVTKPHHVGPEECDNSYLCQSPYISNTWLECSDHKGGWVCPLQKVKWP